MIKLLRRKNPGLMLIEILVAVGIVGLVLVGVSDLLTRAIGATTFQKQKNEALIIVQKMLTDYKIARDTNPESFYNSIANTVIDPCTVGTIYKCTVTVDQAADSVIVSVVAEWQDGGRNYNVKLSQLLAREWK